VQRLIVDSKHATKPLEERQVEIAAAASMKKKGT
jgi:hypothetical protein